MAATSMLVFVIALLVILIPLAIGIALVVKSRGKGLGYPACGTCRYDLSASVGTTDRCPECGLLFVTAGIVPPHGQRQPALLWMGVALLALSLGCAGTGLFASVLSQRAMQRARAAAAAQQQSQAAQQASHQDQQAQPRAEP